MVELNTGANWDIFWMFISEFIQQKIFFRYTFFVSCEQMITQGSHVRCFLNLYLWCYFREVFMKLWCKFILLFMSNIILCYFLENTIISFCFSLDQKKYFMKISPLSPCSSQSEARLISSSFLSNLSEQRKLMGLKHMNKSGSSENSVFGSFSTSDGIKFKGHHSLVVLLIPED